MNRQDERGKWQNPERGRKSRSDTKQGNDVKTHTYVIRETVETLSLS